MRPVYLLPVLAALLAPLPAAAQRGPMERSEIPSLTVTGNSEVRVDPDEATVRLGVTRQAGTAEAAQRQVNEVAQAILEAMNRLGIEKSQIQTSQLTLFPVYAPQRPESPEQPRVVAYRASNIVTVRTGKLGQVGPIIDAGLKAGSNQVEGVSFG
ncbi:MAG TPA: SIMPL domain-containing protein, partial [Armatimonadota bacterium]|nr:SIMPL domain-containing protein [Armatimonadota bacterium]